MTVHNESNRKLRLNFSAFLMGLLPWVLFTGDAHATGLGVVLGNVGAAIGDIGGTAISAISYGAAAGAGLLGAYRTYKHVESPESVPLWDAVKFLLVSAFLFALPGVVNAIQVTTGLNAGTTAEARFNKGGGGTDGLDGMMIKFMASIGTYAYRLVQVFAAVVGLAFIAIGISRLTKSMQEGPRGPAGLGTLFTFLTGSALIGFSPMLGNITQTMFGSRQVASYAELGAELSQAIPNGAGHVEGVIAAVLYFVMLVGWISFARGWILLKKVADADGQDSLMAALTHIFGGVLAVNLGPVLQLMQVSVGIDAGTYGLVFST